MLLLNILNGLLVIVLKFEGKLYKVRIAVILIPYSLQIDIKTETK